MDESYSDNMLNLTLASGYIKKLLDNAKVVRSLNTNHSDILSEFKAIVAAGRASIRSRDILRCSARC